MDHNAVGKKVQKRNRIPLSCLNCRRKKIKCDRRKPTCGVCEAHKLGNCKYYEERVNLGKGNTGIFVEYVTKKAKDPIGDASIFKLEEKGKEDYSIHKSNTDVSKELKMLNEKIKRLEVLIPQPTAATDNVQGPETLLPPSVIPDSYYGQENVTNYDKDYLANAGQLCERLKVDGNDRICVYDGIDAKLSVKTKLGNIGPFSWATIIVKDPFSAPLWQAVARYQETIKNTFKKSTRPVKSNLLNSQKSDEKMVQGVLGRKILNILPNKRAIWLFIGRFFKFVYPFLPYLDQDSFVTEIERIINGNHIMDLENEENVTKLSISQNTDFAILGSFMVVIMCAYESLLDNTGKFHDTGATEEDIYLSKFEQSTLLITYTELCLNEFKLLKRCHLSVLQCALLLEEYQKIDSFHSFAEGDSHIYTGLLIQMATTIGLNRDPAFFEEKPANEKEDLLLRKIWYGLISADNYQYMQTGTPPSIYPCHYDTKLPCFDEKVSNITDLELERVTISLLREKYFMENEMRKLADMVSDMRESPKLKDLLVNICSLMSQVRHRLGTFNGIMMMDHQNLHYKRVEKVSYMIMYMHSLTLIQPVLLHVYYHFQKLRHFDATVFFYNKVLSIWMFVIGNIENLIYSSDKIFGSGFDLFLIPTIEVVMHKGFILFTASYIKALIAGKKLQNLNVKNEELLKVIEFYKSEILMKIFFDIYIPISKRLCKRYFYCWKLLKAHSCIFKLLKEDSIDYSAQFPIFNFMEYFTADNFKTLIQTSSWRYYKAGATMPSWLVAWLQNYQRDIYYIPGQEPISVGKTISTGGGEISLSNEMSDSLTNDITYVDEKWLNKLYQKFASSQKHSYFSNGFPSEQLLVTDENPNDSTILPSTNLTVTELNSISGMMPDNNNMGEYFTSLGLSFDDLMWLD